jgi:hypothetical protein
MLGPSTNWSGAGSPRKASLLGTRRELVRGSMYGVQAARERYAAILRAKIPLRSETLVCAFAEVSLEAFLGPAPWWVLGQKLTTRFICTTMSLVPIDGTRSLMNGLPGFVAGSIDVMGLNAGARGSDPIGCYSAILAKVVSDRGSVSRSRLRITWQSDHATTSRMCHNCGSRARTAVPAILGWLRS